MKRFVILFFAVILISFGCSCQEGQEYPSVSREDVLPDDIQKQTPETDLYPPMLHTDEYETPVPLPSPVNTSGGEDSPFILPDGRAMYFFFTPDVRIPAELQLTDNVTGIWVTYNENGQWTKPQRVWLQDEGKLALDGAPFVQDNEMWFVSAREGYEGMHIFTAQYIDGTWQDWEYADERINGDLMVGELHIYEDELYYHSGLEGGLGSYDIWMTQKTQDGWSDAVNVTAVNTGAMDGYPYISPDGSEMYFTRVYEGSPAIFRSYRVNGQWQAPELLISQFAGEPTLDAEGNLYFVHHYYKDGEMIEADIYVAYKKNTQ